MTEPSTSDRVTRGIRVEVASRYLERESCPDEDHYYFAYDVRITNASDRRAKLVSRHWTIINSEGDRQEVRGAGVVGERPDLEAGESFEYTSFCPLNTHWGTMEGTYHMVGEDGERFDVAVGRFFLVSGVDVPRLPSKPERSPPRRGRRTKPREPRPPRT